MRALASVLGVGFSPVAPGTVGSLVALPMAYALHQAGGFWLLALMTAAVFGLGLSSVQRVTADGGDHDPSWVVIDEVVGQWIALWPVSFGAVFAGAAITDLWPGWIAAFALFRLFDIRKPGLAGRADRMGTPLGVMLDDVIAGIFAAVGVFVLAALYHIPLILAAQ